MRLLIMMFKCCERTGMSASTTMLSNTAMPMSKPVVRQNCTYGNMAESELFCVRVAIYLEGKMLAYKE